MVMLVPAVKPFLDLLVNDSYYISANLYRHALKITKENGGNIEP